MPDCTRHDALTTLFAVTTRSRRHGHDAVATQSQRFCSHNAITRGSRDAVMTVATQSRHGDDAVTTRFVVTTRSRQGHDRITTQSRRSHDRVTTRSRCSRDAFCGHDTVTVTTQSRCSRDAFCGHDAVTTGPTGSRRGHGHDAVTRRSQRVFVLTTRSQQGHDAVTTR